MKWDWDDILWGLGSCCKQRIWDVLWDVGVLQWWIWGAALRGAG